MVENLIATGRAGVEPLRRYERLRKRVLGLDSYHLYDGTIPLVEFDRRYPTTTSPTGSSSRRRCSGADYQARVRRAFAERWIDVYENPGKHSGAYSAAVYGVHPYMLLNWNDTLDSVFTLAHEMGHSMHTMLAHETQPFVYSSYTIFVAEVPSTLSEALLLDYMLARATDPRERVVLLQHAIDEVTGTFYRAGAVRQLRARGAPDGRARRADHRRRTEHALPRAADRLLRGHPGRRRPAAQVTWARIPHFFGSPYYVYQYATCFASSARLLQDVRAADPAQRAEGVRRYPRSAARRAASDHPMALLQGGWRRPVAAGHRRRHRHASRRASSAGSRPSSTASVC